MYPCRSISFLLLGLCYSIVLAIPGLNKVECRYPAVGVPNEGYGPPNLDDCQWILDNPPLR
jgi:hypothetical protein